MFLTNFMHSKSCSMTLRKIGITILLLSGLMVHAQYHGNTYYPYSGNTNLSGNPGAQLPFRSSLQTGASFSSGFGGGSLFNTYLAPSFSQALSKKFTLSAGAVISNTTYSNLNLINKEGSLGKYSGNMTNFTLYAAGAYQVNERLTVTGTAFKTINPAFNNRLNPNQLRMDAQGMSFGVGYKVSDNVHIGAEIRYQQGNSNFYYPMGIPGDNPYMNRGLFGY